MALRSVDAPPRRLATIRRSEDRAFGGRVADPLDLVGSSADESAIVGRITGRRLGMPAVREAPSHFSHSPNSASPDMLLPDGDRLNPAVLGQLRLERRKLDVSRRLSM